MQLSRPFGQRTGGGAQSSAGFYSAPFSAPFSSSGSQQRGRGSGRGTRRGGDTSSRPGRADAPGAWGHDMFGSQAGGEQHGGQRGGRSGRGRGRTSTGDEYNTPFTQPFGGSISNPSTPFQTRGGGGGGGRQRPFRASTGEAEGHVMRPFQAQQTQSTRGTRRGSRGAGGVTFTGDVAFSGASMYDGGDQFAAPAGRGGRRQQHQQQARFVPSSNNNDDDNYFEEQSIQQRQAPSSRRGVRGGGTTSSASLAASTGPLRFTTSSSTTTSTITTRGTRSRGRGGSISRPAAAVARRITSPPSSQTGVSTASHPSVTRGGTNTINAIWVKAPRPELNQRSFLYPHFSRFGNIQAVTIERNFALVKFATYEEAEAALRGGSATDNPAERLRLQWAKPKKEGDVTSPTEQPMSAEAEMIDQDQVEVQEIEDGDDELGEGTMPDEVEEVDEEQGGEGEGEEEEEVALAEEEVAPLQIRRTIRNDAASVTGETSPRLPLSQRIRFPASRAVEVEEVQEEEGGGDEEEIVEEEQVYEGDEGEGGEVAEGDELAEEEAVEEEEEQEGEEEEGGEEQEAGEEEEAAEEEEEVEVEPAPAAPIIAQRPTARVSLRGAGQRSDSLNARLLRPLGAADVDQQQQLEEEAAAEKEDVAPREQPPTSPPQRRLADRIHSIVGGKSQRKKAAALAPSLPVRSSLVQRPSIISKPPPAAAAAATVVKQRLMRRTETRDLQALREGFMQEQHALHRSIRQMQSGKQHTGIIGLCRDMCAASERQEREMNKDLSRFEMEPGTEHFTGRGQAPKVRHEWAVKKYHRPTVDLAGETPSYQRPEEVRPPTVLLTTMEYLTQMLDRTDVAYTELEKFVRDRTRAIRQDFVLQRGWMDDLEIEVVERICRFHILSDHRLCEEDQANFDQQMNLEQLNKSLITLAQLYADHAAIGVFFPTEAEFRAYFIITHLDTPVEVMSLLLSLRPEVYNSLEVQTVLDASAAIRQGNYVRFFDVCRRAPYLIACLLHRYWSRARLEALTTMNTVYKGSSMLLTKLVKLLALEDQNEAQSLCLHYGLPVAHEVDGLAVLLGKTALVKPSVALLRRVSYSIIEAKAEGIAIRDLVELPTCLYSGEATMSTGRGETTRRGGAVEEEVEEEEQEQEEEAIEEQDYENEEQEGEEAGEEEDQIEEQQEQQQEEEEQSPPAALPPPPAAPLARTVTPAPLPASLSRASSLASSTSSSSSTASSASFTTPPSASFQQQQPALLFPPLPPPSSKAPPKLSLTTHFIPIHMSASAFAQATSLASSKAPPVSFKPPTPPAVDPRPQLIAALQAKRRHRLTAWTWQTWRTHTVQRQRQREVAAFDELERQREYFRALSAARLGPHKPLIQWEWEQLPAASLRHTPSTPSSDQVLRLPLDVPKIVAPALLNNNPSNLKHLYWKAAVVLESDDRFSSWLANRLRIGAVPPPTTTDEEVWTAALWQNVNFDPITFERTIGPPLAFCIARTRYAVDCAAFTSCTGIIFVLEPVRGTSQWAEEKQRVLDAVGNSGLPMLILRRPRAQDVALEPPTDWLLGSLEGVTYNVVEMMGDVADETRLEEGVRWLAAAAPPQPLLSSLPLEDIVHVYAEHAVTPLFRAIDQGRMHVTLSELVAAFNYSIELLANALASNAQANAEMCWPPLELASFFPNDADTWQTASLVTSADDVMRCCLPEPPIDYSLASMNAYVTKLRSSSNAQSYFPLDHRVQQLVLSHSGNDLPVHLFKVFYQYALLALGEAAEQRIYFPVMGGFESRFQPQLALQDITYQLELHSRQQRQEEDEEEEEEQEEEQQQEEQEEQEDVQMQAPPSLLRDDISRKRRLGDGDVTPDPKRAASHEENRPATTTTTTTTITTPSAASSSMANQVMQERQQTEDFVLRLQVLLAEGV